MMFKGFPALRSGLGALAAALLLLGGAARAQTRDSLKVGYLPVTGQAKFFVAQEYGLFAKEGLDVELIEFQNSADGLAALRGGKLDLGAFGTTAPLVHIAKGADLRAEQEGLRVVIRSKDLDPALLEKGYYSDYLDQASDPNVKGVSAFWATMQASEFIDSKQAIRPFIDTSVYKKALDGLAREFPRDPYWKGLEKVFAQRDV
jgi:hypothetical protein